jgi:ABC-type multidrug transport system ATPase subunit
VFENLDFVARVYEVASRREAVRAIMDRMGLADRSGQLAGQLSGGWKQRLALAACVLHKPQLLLLDEPTAGVDAQARRQFWDLIHDMASEGLTTLVSTHYMDEAERCNRIVYLADGRIVAQGAPDEVVRQAALVTFEAAIADADQAAHRLRQRRVSKPRCLGARFTLPAPTALSLNRRWRNWAARRSGERSRRALKMHSFIC